MHHVTMILFMCSIKKYQLAVAIIGVTLDVVMANPNETEKEVQELPDIVQTHYRGWGEKDLWTDTQIVSEKSKRDTRVTILQSFLAGGMAGVAARTLTSPLEVVKTVAQVSTPAYSPEGIAPTIGVRGFWRGNSIACVRVWPYNAIQFYLYTLLKDKLSDPKTGQWYYRFPLAFLSGTVAGTAAMCVTYPMDVIKTRMTLTTCDKTKAKYKSSFSAFWIMMRQESPLVFFTGIWPSLIGVVPFAGGSFMAYELLGSMWGKPEDMHPVHHFINGCLAATFGMTLSYPFDTIRKKMQMYTSFVPPEMRPDVDARRTIYTASETVRRHGPAALWRGYTVSLFRVVPFAGITFAVFEASKNLYIWMNGYVMAPFDHTPRPGVDQYASPDEVRKMQIEERGRHYVYKRK